MIGLGISPLVARLLRRDHMFVWVTNAGAAILTANSIISLIRAGVSGADRLVVAVLDDRSTDIIKSFKLDVSILRLFEDESWCALKLEAGESYNDYNTQSFRTVGLARYLVIEQLLVRYRRPIAYADSDVVYLRDPSPHFKTLQSWIRPAVLVQNDRRADLESKEWSRQYDIGTRPGRSVICSGFSVWQPAREHYRILKTIRRRMLAENELHSDQVVFNKLDDELLSCVRLLRQDLFPNGSMCFGNKYRPHEPIDPPEFDWSGATIVHANWMIGIGNKVAALKDAGLCFL